MAMIVAVSTFVNWSTQGEPFVERWKNWMGNSMNVYTQTAKQIYDNEGKTGVEKFLATVEGSHPNRDVCLATGLSNCSNEFGSVNVAQIVKKAFDSNQIEFDFINPEENYIAQKFTTQKGENLVLVMKIDVPRPPIPFGPDWRTRTIRILAILLTAALVCYILAQYLVKPILKLRQATQKLADGKLDTRIHSKRRDELGKLANDFDVMSEHIESLISSQRRLTRDISHELRSPLARMNVALELAKAKTQNGTSTLLNRIETESIRLNEMISNILTLSKLETKSETVEKMEVNLTKIFENVVTDARFEAEPLGKTVEVLKKDNVKMQGNERLLQSAIENVLRNAIRYTRDKVEISLENKEDSAIVKIRDYGEGIPEKDLQEIFRPFYRVSEARDRKSGGIGLGLSITEQAVNAHRGNVSAKNTGDGLLVEIKLPLNVVRQQTI